MAIYLISLGRNKHEIRVYIRRQNKAKKKPNAILYRDEHIISTVATTLMFYQQHFPKRQVQEWIINSYSATKGNVNHGGFLSLTRNPKILAKYSPEERPRMTFEQGLEAFLDYMKLFVTAQGELQ